MINFIQLNQHDNELNKNIITIQLWNEILLLLVGKNKSGFKERIFNISVHYNTDKITIIKDFVMFLLKNKPEYIKDELLSMVEMIFHSNNLPIDNVIDYFYESFS
jgi:hypothetical protein